MSSAWDDPVVEAYARKWWDAKLDILFKSTYLGVPCVQHPGDAWVTQEIISETRPEVIVETGRLGGGSTIMWAHLLELLDIDGLVVSVELNDLPLGAREHPIWERRVREVNGSSVAPEVVAAVAEHTAGRRTMVILDSDHSQAHVEQELEAYTPMVTPGCYCIVQDGFVSRDDPSHGPGPLEATLAFLAQDDRFEADRSRERMMHTLNPSGFLRRR
jgi:cephalosporin hydroxylase